MKTVICCNCVTKFAMTDEVYAYKLNSGTSFWCPNGHSQYFTNHENAIDLLAKTKKQLERKKDALLKKRNKYTIGGMRWEIYDGKAKAITESLKLLGGSDE